MTNSTFTRNSTAVSEVVGAVLLILIAVAVFSIIYLRVFPVPFPSPEPHVQIAAKVTDFGSVILEHVGGDALDCYEIHVQQNREVRISRSTNTWVIGEIYNLNTTLDDQNEPLLNISEFLNDNDSFVRVFVYSLFEDGSSTLVFDGVLTPTEHPDPAGSPVSDPMLISTLRKNTTDEDLLCYSYLNNSLPTATAIYKWTVKPPTALDFTPFTRLLLPFDTNNLFITKDYSGNHNNGTITGATWSPSGKLGGAYQFLGNEFISIPYCFSNPTLDTITVEAWVKTSLPSGTILSYDRSKYFELAIKDGYVKWTTKTTEGAEDLTGTIPVDDNTWHLIAATYDTVSGACGVYIDGQLDVESVVHTPGSLLGTDIPPYPLGYIGRGTGAASRETLFSTDFETQAEKNTWAEHNSTGQSQATWTNLRYDTFNSGMGSYTDGGSDCYRTNSYSSEGGYSVCIRDNNGVSSSFYLTNSIDLHTPEYKSLMVDFWWMWNDNGWSTGEDWWLQYYNGYSWETILDTNYPSGYAKDVWHHTIVYINETEHTYPTNMRLRFMCDASYDNDRVYFDQIYINASSYGRIECDFDRLPSTALTPRTGSYSLGGSGDFDPEYAAFNRTSIDLSLYTDVELSVWYSYKDTEAADFFGLYYYNLTHWTPIFEIHTPQSAGQFPWTEATVSIPDEIDDLIIQFKWMTSSTTEYVAIDDLVITGLPQAGENNFTGLIDEVKIYPRVLSIEQLYQNYLCTQDSTSARNVSVIVAEETVEGETWQCFVTPNDGVYDYAIKDSNTIEIGGGG